MLIAEWGIFKNITRAWRRTPACGKEFRLRQVNIAESGKLPPMLKLRRAGKAQSKTVLPDWPATCAAEHPI